jgi:hypothetical protein
MLHQDQLEQAQRADFFARATANSGVPFDPN